MAPPAKPSHSRTGLSAASLTATAAAAASGAAAAAFVIRSISYRSGRSRRGPGSAGPDASRALKAVQAELDALKENAAASAQAAPGSSQMLVAELKSQVAATEKEKAALTTSSAVRLVHADAASREPSESAMRVSEMGAEIGHLKQILDEALSQANERGELLIQATSKLAAAEAAAAAAAKELADLKLKADSQLDTHMTSREQANVALLAATKTLESSESDLKTATTQAANAIAKAEQLESQLAQKAGAIASLEADLTASKAAASQVASLEEELSEVKAERATLQSQIASVMLEHAASISARSVEAAESSSAAAVEATASAEMAAATKVSALEKQVNELKAEQRTVKGSLQQSQQEKKLIEAAYACTLGDAERYQKQISDLELNVAALKTSSNTLQQELEAAQREAAEKLSSASIRNELAVAQATELESKVIELQKENGRLNDSLAAAGAADAAMAALQLMVTRLECEKKAADVKASEKEAQISTLTAEHEKLQGKFSQLNTEAASHTAVSESTSDQAHQLLMDYQQLKEKHMALIHETKIKDDMMELLQQQLSELADMDSILLGAMPAGRHKASRGNSVDVNQPEAAVPPV